MMSLTKQKTRLKSISNLHSILSAMQIVTMVRMQRIREKNVFLESYLNPIREILGGRVHKRETKKKKLVLISSSRGLCGSFNSELFKKVEDFIGKNKNLDCISIGKKSDNFFKRRRVKILLADHGILDKYDCLSACDIFKKIFDKDAELFIAYNSYQTGSLYFPVIRKIYPIPYELVTKSKYVDIVFEPDYNKLIEELLYHYLETSFYQIIVNSQISEYTARLIVLKGAVDNSQELTDRLVLNINKARQADITKDLSEIIASAQVLRRVEDE